MGSHVCLYYLDFFLYLKKVKFLTCNSPFGQNLLPSTCQFERVVIQNAFYLTLSAVIVSANNMKVSVFGATLNMTTSVKRLSIYLFVNK